MKIALGQFTTDTDKAVNLAQAEAAIREASQNGAQLLVLPETFMAFIPPSSATCYADIAEPLEGPFVTRLCTAAHTAGIYLAVGIFERNPEDTVRVWNTTLLIDNHGKLLHAYRKTHLYDAFSYQESRNIIQGDNAIQVVNTELGRIGLMVCYELRFPEIARELALQGADFIIVPTAWVHGPLKEQHFQTLVCARALENTLPVVVCDQTGNIYSGRSLVCDAMGVPRNSMGIEQGIIYSDIDYEHTRTAREALPCLEHRRAELYTLLSK
ncbi:carbon-nitrogen hydrolase family protein [Shimwellia blattae]|uniref:Putative hydrolase n=1 Tax=Shimwellia blattae (strain ATCC 29907 / DSM 4481 / JCM 1650 / NBRC 105725 / CDC 9005-74) TaxID=630626 RepID=I2B5M5_SHIBC|nr:carbon-nitrogen hydrolase family protein [Shimwellia blattae]AFJ45829.1 putative hydrolase [Shimwellia blattae DSM 4481 = NBRC 105725]GAB83229.1 putative hydrolase YbeM [Shimwellia blattae DSM 4481 = NBRC 105725]VDY63308.1 (R)-stereoselective amidase [Shimwellia blattae]VEC21075.1 (R)-stereoselective amidase [Shimwellia blattae]